MKIGFNFTPDSVCLIDVDNAQLWIVFTAEQYAAVNVKHGHFKLQHDKLSFTGEKTIRSGALPPMQHLTGLPAQILADVVLQVIQKGRPDFRQFISGIASVNWRANNGESCTVVCGHGAQGLFFAVVFSLPQLEKVGLDFFPTQQLWRVQAFQSGARLPSETDRDRFVVEGNVAVQFIQGCWLTKRLR